MISRFLAATVSLMTLGLALFAAPSHATRVSTDDFACAGNDSNYACFRTAHPGVIPRTAWEITHQLPATAWSSWNHEGFSTDLRKRPVGLFLKRQRVTDADDMDWFTSNSRFASLYSLLKKGEVRFATLDHTSSGVSGPAIVGELPASVPVPETLWLFASGLFGFVGIARRRQAINPSVNDN